MTATDKLAGVRAKLDRANKHIADLDVAIAAFLDSRPYPIGTKSDANTRQLTYYVVESPPIPSEISLICGDAIHCLRSSLDHLAYQMFLASGGAEKFKSVSFPIFDDVKKFEAGFRGKIHGISNAAGDMLQEIQPYKGGKGNDLWVLHYLNNTDKHRLLVPTGVGFKLDIAAIAEREATRLLGDRWEWAKDAFTTVERYFGPKSCIKTGHELFVDVPDAEFDENVKFRFDIAFNEAGVIEGEPILPTLKHFVNIVNDVFKRLIRFI